MKTFIKTISQSIVSNSVFLFALAAPAWAQNTNVEIARPVGVEGITNISKFIQSALTLAIIIAAVLTFAYLIWGGIQWITSGGDKSANEAARNRITSALVGLAIVAAAWALMQLIGYFFGVNITEGLDIPTASGGL